MALKNKLLKFTIIAVASFLSLSAHAGWQQTFADEFDGPTLDFGKWVTSNYWGQHTRLDTNEKECYVDNLVNVGSGSLSLTATTDIPVNCSPDTGILAYSSGEISTASSFRQAYGYFEVRAKMPKGKGLWPQFRLDQFGGSYPPRPPEIIATQTYGSASQAQPEYDDLDLNGQVVRHFQTMDASVDLSAGYHTYGVDWQPGLLIWYFDGVEVYRYAAAGIYSQPMYMILNLAVGGDLAGDPDATTVFPATMQVDYVHAYARLNDGTPDTLPPGVQPPPPPPPPSDVTPPKVTLVARGNGTVKRGQTLVLAAAATDNVKVTSLTISVNGVNVCSGVDRLNACQFTIPDDTSVSSYTATAIAKDAAGNIGTAIVKVTVK